MDYHKYSDEELILYIQNNFGDGFSEVIDRYEKKLLGYITRILKDEDLSEDVLQETFIAAYENINGFDPKRKFSSWIYRIAHNKAINEIRKGKNKVSIDDAPEIASSEGREKIEAELGKKEVKKVLEKEIETLPLKYKEIVILRFFEEKSYEEISDILKIPISTVGVRIRRGLAKLKSNININPEDYL
ncbi:MAG: sigma-70 family RNA polymerase sigma factor [Patescibacteria group bacterium]|nr:sigma-70 family RNA polymerase sigma factor [Patescibacteria group bacterium]